MNRATTIALCFVGGCSAAIPVAPAGGPPPTCAIDGMTLQKGTARAGNSCQVCDPATSRVAWSVVPDLNACTTADLTGTYCAGGRCIAACGIGGQVIPEGAQNLANPCQVCDPIQNLNVWTNTSACAVSDGGLGDAGASDAGPDAGVAAAGDSDAGAEAGGDAGAADGGVATACQIGGATLAAGAAAPANACESCQPAVSATAYSPVPNGTLCSSAGGNVCVSGLCQPGCYLAGALVAAHTFQSASADACCNPDLSALAWTPGFTPLPPIAVANATKLMSGKFNADALADLVVGSSNGTLQAFYGQPDGGFAVSPLPGGSGAITALASADLNGDGLADVLFLDATRAPALLLQQASGGFTQAGSWGEVPDAAGLWAENTTSGPQVATLDPQHLPVIPPKFPYVGSSGTDSNVIFEGYSRGTLVDAGNPVGVQVCTPISMAFGSFDSPAAIEAVVFCDGPSYQAAVYLQYKPVYSSNPQWIATVSTATFTGSSSYVDIGGSVMVSGDFNGDGYSDLAAVSLDNSVSYYVNVPGPGLGFPTTMFLPKGAIVNDVAFGTFRGPGSQQLAVAESGNGVLDVIDVDIDAGPVASYPAGPATALAVGDFNGDGRDDVAVITVPANSAGTAVQVFQRQCP